jgi:hypothetical protein
MQISSGKSAAWSTLFNHGIAQSYIQSQFIQHSSIFNSNYWQRPFYIIRRTVFLSMFPHRDDLVCGKATRWSLLLHKNSFRSRLPDTKKSHHLAEFYLCPHGDLFRTGL